MKLLSILILSVMLSTSNVVMAGADKQQKKTQKFDQAKTRILQGVTTRIEILNKFKSCVEKTKARPELKMCRSDKKSAMQALKLENQQAREQRQKTREVEKKTSK